MTTDRVYSTIGVMIEKGGRSLKQAVGDLHMKTGKLDAKLLKDNVSQRILKDIEEQRVGGAAVAVLQNGKLVLREDYGLQSLDRDELLRKDAVFRIASMTKPITAAAVFLQAQRGKLDLNDEVSQYLPNYKNIPLDAPQKFCSIPMRIWHLLTHTSGMETRPLYKEWMHQMPMENKRTLAGAVDYYATLPVEYEPGTLRRYSGVAAFDVLARIVEITAGIPFEDFVRDEILIPCGMKDTTFAPSPDQFDRMIGLHDMQDGRSVAVATEPGRVVDGYPVTHPLGGAGLASTVDDYIKFAEFLRNKGVTEDSRRILAEEWIDLMATAQLPEELMSKDVNQGLGVRVISGDGYPWLPVGTFGWSGAYGTHFWVDPVNQITAIYMKNSKYDGGSGAQTAKNFEEDVFLSIV